MDARTIENVNHNQVASALIEIPFHKNQIELISKLSSNTDNKVYLGLYDKLTVVFKIFKNGKTEAEKKRMTAEFKQEAKMLWEANCSYVVKIIGITLNDHQSIIMEYCQGGSIFEYLLSGQDISWEQAQNWLVQVVTGLGYLHDLKIIHGDIATRNLFFSKSPDEADCSVKIGDFGLACNAEDYLALEVIQNTKAKPRSTTAPERWQFYKQEDLKNTYPIGIASDCWSFGTTIFEIASGGYDTFHYSNCRELFSYLTVLQHCGIWKFWGVPKLVPPEIKQLVTDCMQFDPLKRPSTKEIKEKLVNCKLTLFGNIPNFKKELKQPVENFTHYVPNRFYIQ